AESIAVPDPREDLLRRLGVPLALPASLTLARVRLRRQTWVWYRPNHWPRFLPPRLDRGHACIEIDDHSDNHTCSVGLFRHDDDAHCWLPEWPRWLRPDGFCWWGRARVNRCLPTQQFAHDPTLLQRPLEFGFLPLRWQGNAVD